MRGKVNPGLQL
jgi:hypothetical protein